jgi:hypothetical protein
MSEVPGAGKAAAKNRREADFLTQLSGRSPRERRVALLALLIHRGGQITPKWSVEAVEGYQYWPDMPFSLHALLTADLEYLAANDYLERTHFDRIHRCGSCGSHLLNIREICVECASANLENLPVLHHFRCGYVAPIGEFETRGRGRDCPKCGHTMRNLGTDHEVVGEQVRCRSCGVTFDEPVVEAVCFRCGAKTPGENLVSADVWGFRLTPLGQSAARAGRLFVEDDERLVEPETQVFRRGVFLKLLQDDLRIRKRYNIPCSVIVVRLRYANPVAAVAGEGRVLEVLNAMLRNVDQIGRFDETGLVIKLPATDADGAEIVRGRLAERINALEGIQALTSVAPLRDDGGVETEIAVALNNVG